jgi:3-hydroxyacyl-[acyl-carrier-protein] dehydratase
VTGVKVDGYRAAAAPLPATDWVEVESGPRGGLSVRAGKKVDPGDDYLVGHFPELTIYPGVFTLETVRQAVITAAGLCAGRLPELYRLHSVRFLAPLLAGDTLTVDVTIGPIEDDEAFEVTAACRRDDGVVAARVKARYRWGAPDEA